MNFGLQEDVINQIKSVLAKHSNINTVIIYGSRAKGNFKIGSDIDLTIKGNHLNISLVYKIEQELDDLYLPYSFDISIYNHIDNNDLKDHIKRIGKVFYQNIEDN